MSSIGVERRMLLVHAHPDDETIFTGATMAKYAAEGARVSLVTCTMGERGFIPRTHPATRGRDLPPGDERMELTAGIRAKELEAACAELGVTEHWYLGGLGRWRDSGVKDCGDPRAFCSAGVDEAADELGALIQRVQPQVMVTYDANGFYGHPDHIQAHRVAWRAYQQFCDPLRTRFYALTMPRSVLAGAINDARQSQQGGSGKPVRPDSFPHVGLPDNQVEIEIRADSFMDAKLAALKAHATQVAVDGHFFQAVGLVRMRVLTTEYYSRWPILAVGTGSPGELRGDDFFWGSGDW